MRTYLFIFDDSYKPDLLMFVMLLSVIALIVLLSYVVNAFCYLKSMVKLVRVDHPNTDRMLGFRTGLHNKRFYFRIELWSISYRLEFGEQIFQDTSSKPKIETHENFDPHAR